MNIIKTLIFSAVLMISSYGFASSIPDTDTIPSALDPWKPWVLHGEGERFCPFLYNNGNAYKCQWPSALEMDLDDNGGKFAQQWHIFKEGWVPLPGAKEQWPADVKIDEKPAPVLLRNGIPSTYLNPGDHLIKGMFAWTEIPETIHISPSSGLVSLSINGLKIDFPLFDNRGNLWLHRKTGPMEEEDHVDMSLSRLINDKIPMEITSNLKINISGREREINISGILLDGFIPMEIMSPIPARMGSDGKSMMIQARPGRWEIRVIGRSQGPVFELSPPADMPFGEEIWAFQSQNHLRMVKVEDVTPTDPTRTDIPNEWKGFPVYIIRAGEQMRLKEIKRGDPMPAPDQIHLKRTYWLDFDGKGFTIQDEISGFMSRQWYLSMNPPGLLGRVSVDNIDQLITKQGKDEKPGVELRKGKLNLVSESRFEASTKDLPAVGWDHDFQSLSATLNLPPGWKLLTAKGIDTVSGTWLSQWTLLDIFLVLIIALAIAKLWNYPLGLLALLMLGITFHEMGAPRLVWLHILAANALLRYIPRGWVRKIVTLWYAGAFIALLVIAVPFMVQQIRLGIYPQLESHRAVDSLITGGQAARPRQDVSSAKPPARVKRSRSQPGVAKLEGKAMPYMERSQTMGYDLDISQKQPLMVQDPKALIQTGPGLPQWRWRSFNMKWNGPVDRSQYIRLWLVSPITNLILGICRVVLLAFLIFIIIDLRNLKISSRSVASVTMFLCMMAGLHGIPGMTPEVTAKEQVNHGFPSKDILNELKERLLEKPDCLPNCADSPHMKLSVDKEKIQMNLQIHAALETAVPLPGSLDLWSPEQVFVDSRPATGLSRDDDGILWVLVPKGIHTVTVIGIPGGGNSIEILLPLKPRQVTVQIDGWDVHGIGKDGRVEGDIRLTREEKGSGTDPSQHTMILAPFLHIERTLLLGLNWQIRTTVTRVTPVGSPVVISIPLVDGESITSAGVSMRNNMAQVNMGPKIREVRWISTLEMNQEINLEAAMNVPWTETWILDASPIWHCELKGIPVIHHQDQAGKWKPQWRPWPGEKVIIKVSRPEAIPGQSVTIDSAKLALTPGKRFDKAELSLTMRSSQGGQHKILLPDAAKLQKVMINGKTQPIREDGRDLTFPLRPGSQAIDVEWHQDSDSAIIKESPDLTIGDRAVNADIVFKMPANRWILLTGGPILGPAVLFWSYLAVIIIAAIGLGRIKWTPLKTLHWLLLGLGLTQVHPLVAILVVGWIIALTVREKQPMPAGWFYFNACQIILVIWTIAALIGLYIAIQKGLLGIPNMQISGNGSYNFWLHWTQDRIGPMMPKAWVISLPLIVFRILMLLWALWLAYSLLKWLRWGWNCFGKDGMWRKPSFARKEIDLSDEISLEEEE